VRIGDSWFCERCRPARSHAPRAVAATPLAAMDAFEQLIMAEGARLEETLRDSRDDDSEVAFQAYSSEIGRGLTSLRKAIAPQKPPASPDGAPRSRRTPKKIKATERHGDGQVDWVAETAAAEPAREP
jgi:hypothetical protein